MEAKMNQELLKKIARVLYDQRLADKAREAGVPGNPEAARAYRAGLSSGIVASFMALKIALAQDPPLPPGEIGKHVIDGLNLAMSGELDVGGEA